VGFASWEGFHIFSGCYHYNDNYGHCFIIVVSENKVALLRSAGDDISDVCVPRFDE